MEGLLTRVQLYTDEKSLIMIPMLLVHRVNNRIWKMYPSTESRPGFIMNPRLRSAYAAFSISNSHCMLNIRAIRLLTTEMVQVET